MTRSDDREQCVRFLYECLEEGAFSNLVMKGEEVSDFVRAAVYGTLTYTVSIDFLIKHLAGKDVDTMDPFTRTVIRFGTWQIVFSDKVPDYAAVSTSVELIKKSGKGSAGFVNAVLRAVATSSSKERDISQYRPEIATSLKSEIYGILKKCYGKEHALQIGKSFLVTPELTVRYNAYKKNRTEVISDLERDGFIVHEGHFIPEALVIIPTEGARIDRSPSFINGEFFVQSEGAMLASLIASPKTGDKILDCCSAPGGKATHMAEIAGNDCSVTCLDINASRLRLIKENADRLGITALRLMEADSTDISSVLTGEEGTYDIVTADVPCSGMGLLGKKPDIRHTLTYERMKELLPRQKAILESASKFVKPGGRLVYSTCTLNKAENEEQVQVFLENHPDFYAEDISSRLPEGLIIDIERSREAKSGYITLFPDRDLCDGFFVASLRRKG